MQALEAVGEAHAAGIVHRDVKPANLFLARRRDGSRCLKVLDFGISKLSSADLTKGVAAMTATQGLLGSPLYMSPEQLQSARDVDGRSDIWSVGVILHQLVSGSCPFNADTLPQLVVKVLSTPPTPVRLVCCNAPEEFETVVRRCLTSDRAARPQTVAELAALLVPFGTASSRASLAVI